MSPDRTRFGMRACSSAPRLLALDPLVLALSVLGTMTWVLFHGPSLAAGEAVDARAAPLPAIVFAERDTIAADPSGVITRSRRGRLAIREPARGDVRYLVSNSAGVGSTPVDVTDPDVSYDAERVLFSGYSPRERAWRIYEVRVDGSELRQITTSDGDEFNVTLLGVGNAALQSFDDLDPCYLPDGRICFVSTRYPALIPSQRQRATNLFVVNPDGSDLHRITTERFGADTPAVDPISGKIVYSRWWHSLPLSSVATGTTTTVTDSIPPGGYYNTGPPPPPPPSALSGVTESAFSGVNNWFLSEINPDGEGLRMFSGFRLDRQASQAWKPSFFEDGTALSLFLPELPKFGTPGRKGLRKVEPGATAPEELAGVQTFQGDAISDFEYASAVPLADGRILVTGRFSNDQSANLYIQSDRRALPSFLTGQRSFAEIDAVPVVTRDTPPVIVDELEDRLAVTSALDVESAYERGTFKFVVENLHFNAPVDVDMPHAPPVGFGLAIEFYMAPPQGDSASPKPILIERRDVPASGRVEVELPAGVPLFEVLRRPNGEIARGRDGQVYHVGGMNYGRVGTRSTCVGCHMGHSMMEMPADPEWTNLATSAELGLRSQEKLVDRSTAEGSTASAGTASLEWQEPIYAREVVLYAPRPGPLNEQRISAVILRAWDGTRRTAMLDLEQTISPEGSRFELAASDGERVRLDRLEVIVPDGGVEGTYHGRESPVLAEIEVIARATGTARFRRSDTNCDSVTDLSDAVATLTMLFAGSDDVCCLEAADFDADERVDLGDAVALLNHLVKGGREPADPFESCGTVTNTGRLGCEESRCRS